MLHQPEMWRIMQDAMPRARWVSLEEIYGIIESKAGLDDEDVLPQSPTSDLPKWKRNVRNVLQYRKSRGDLLWDGDAKYWLD